MPARKPDTVLSWPEARELAAGARVDPRTIQLAAKGQRGPGDAGRRARAAVNAYFAEHPDKAPEGWASWPPEPPPRAPKPRPASAPLPPRVARELAIRARCDRRTIQRAAAGLAMIGESGRAALAAVNAYFEENPEARPVRGHVLAPEAGEPSHLGDCDRCGHTGVASGEPCAADEPTFVAARAAS